MKPAVREGLDTEMVQMVERDLQEILALLEGDDR